MWLIFFGRVLRSAALFGDHMGSFRNPRVVFWKGQLVCGRKSERCFFDGTDLAGLDMIHSGWWFGTFSIFPYIGNNRRKFRSQTSDNMDRWKAEQGRGREKRKIRRKKSRRERVRRKKMQMREKVGKSRNTVFFQWFVAPEGRKVGSLKRRVRSQLARWEMKNCTPLWREAHFQVKMYKTHQLRTTFGSWDVEKVHAVVARSTFRSQNVQNTPFSDHFWRFRCRFKSKCTLTHHARTTFGGSDVEKVHAVVARGTFQVKMYKTPHVRATFGSSDVEKVHAVVARSYISKSKC